MTTSCKLGLIKKTVHVLYIYIFFVVEVAKMMQTQDRKLKQVRSAERSIATVMT